MSGGLGVLVAAGEQRGVSDPDDLAQLSLGQVVVHPQPAVVEEGAQRVGLPDGVAHALVLALGEGEELFDERSQVYPHLQALRAQLADDYATKTVNRKLSAVRGVLRAAWRLGQIDTDTLHRVRRRRRPRQSTAGRARSGDARAPAAPRGLQPIRLPARGARDAAALALLSGTGIEAVALDLEHGGWLSLRGSEPGPLPFRVLKGGHIRPWRLRPAAIGLIVERRVREAGLKAATPHDFRRPVGRPSAPTTTARQRSAW